MTTHSHCFWVAVAWFVSAGLFLVLGRESPAILFGAASMAMMIADMVTDKIVKAIREAKK